MYNKGPYDDNLCNVIILIKDVKYTFLVVDVIVRTSRGRTTGRFPTMIHFDKNTFFFTMATTSRGEKKHSY